MSAPNFVELTVEQAAARRTVMKELGRIAWEHQQALARAWTAAQALHPKAHTPIKDRIVDEQNAWKEIESWAADQLREGY